MDIAFAEERDIFIVIYLDDITFFSNSDKDHLKHLKHVFQKCKRFVISLNPKKSNFSMQEGKLLGHVISKEGIKIDPRKVATIQKIDTPENKKEVKYFLERVNFLRRFIPNVYEIDNFITHMLRNYNQVKWTNEERGPFDDIKRSLIEAPVLISPDYSKYFMIFYFSLEHTIAGVLLQKNDHNLEHPISFYSI
jgi:hypothetical protein